ncbi:cyclophilin-like fold protein [Phocaeicola plebeius]|jgi:hypothetical protein|uniref:Cyclophilin-like domain-containing protein n=1 Tax=Phocaeicola plebeius TaxID=310297 RepID=A0A414FTH1_9BACT|nr:cyclophilin-like fold protein [Phocaeicola plebeius]RHD54028.1 hypothetical protein DW789_09475 [Phocaeicola plebeius]
MKRILLFPLLLFAGMTLFACNPSDDTPSAPETTPPGQSGNDRQTTTSPGDLILYQGNSFVIYYDTNSWNFTRLGKVDGVSSRNEMLDLLGGKGEVTVTLSLAE